jgi:hypothetical protein
VFGQAAETRYVPRVRAVLALPTNLTPEQVDACYDFLAQKLENQDLPDLEFNGLKNELVFALTRQRRKPGELASRLVAMYRDRSLDSTWRDYCVQFFGKWYADAPRNEGREAMAAALWEVLRTERANRFAGAAATQLGFLAGKHPEFPRDEVAAACLEALLDPICSETAKVALLPVCATLGVADALPEARRHRRRGLSRRPQRPRLAGAAGGIIRPASPDSRPGRHQPTAGEAMKNSTTHFLSTESTESAGIFCRVAALTDGMAREFVIWSIGFSD